MVSVFLNETLTLKLYNSKPMVALSFLSISLYALFIIKALQFEVKQRFDSTAEVKTTLKTELFGTKLEGNSLNLLFVFILAPHLSRQVTLLWRLLNNSQVHQRQIIYAVVPSITYVIQFLHSLLFVLHFKQAHQPVKTVNLVNLSVSVV